MPTLEWSGTIYGGTPEQVQEAWFSEHWQVAHEAFWFLPLPNSVICHYLPSSDPQPFNRVGEGRLVFGVLREEVVAYEPGKIQYTVTRGPVSSFLATVRFENTGNKDIEVNTTLVTWRITFSALFGTLTNPIASVALNFIIPRFIERFKDNFESLNVPGRTSPASGYEELFGVLNDAKLQDPASPVQLIVMWGFMILKDPIHDLDALRSHFRKTLVVPFPRMRSYVSTDKSSKFWIPQPRTYTVMDASEIDMSYHVQKLEQKPEESWSLQVVAEKATQIQQHLVWEARKPAWKAFVVDRVQHVTGMRSCVVMAIGHEIGDGAVVTAMLFNNLASPLDPLRVPTVPTRSGKLMRGNARSYAPLWRQVVFSFSETIRAAVGKNLPVDVNNSLKMPLGSVPKTRHMYFGQHNLPVNKLKEIKNRYPGSTVNHVLLAVVAIATRRYFVETGEENALKHGVHCQVPMNVRGIRNSPLVGRGFSNQIATQCVCFPLHVPNSQVIPKIIENLALISLSYGGAVSRWYSGVTSRFLPVQVMWKLYLDMVANVTMQVTSLRLPDVGPMQIDGNELVDIGFTAMAAMPMYGGWLSYEGKVNLSVSVDGNVGDTTTRWMEHIKPAFEELYHDVILQHQST